MPTESTGATPVDRSAGLVEAGRVRRISPTPGRNPAIDGDRVVWSGGSNFQVFLYDLSAETERQISSTGGASGPEIDGDRIVWSGPGVGATDLWVYDLSAGTETQLSLSGDQGAPAISGNRIVYEGRRLGSWDIYMYDLSTGVETVITSAPWHQRSPAISGDRIVWMDLRGAPDGGIYLYDLSTGTQTQISPRGFDPDVHGARIVWEWNSDIYLLDLSTGAQRVISSAPREQQSPRISGDWIVWEDSRAATRPDIFLYDLSTDSETQLTTDVHPTQELVPDVSGNRVVWRQVGASEGIYVFEGDPAPNQPPTATITSPASGTTFTEGDEIDFAGSGSDPEDGPLTGGSLVWTSSQDGEIGTGSSFSRSDLSTGTHTITLIATDSQGLTGTASVTINVTAPPPPPCTQVDVLVGNRQPPGTVDLGIPWLEVSVLSIESYLPRPNARAEDVRIGTSWESGTPAMHFRVGDHDSDGRRDIVLRFDLARLTSEGNLSESTSSLTVWGRAHQTGSLFCGTAAVDIVQ